MVDMVGEAIDRLITIEAKNRGMPHGILLPMYLAARQVAGDKPVTMAAARGLKKALGKGDVVFIMTGAGYEPTMPKGESDGPPGAASLARILYRGLGAVPVYVNEACHADPIIASSEAAHLMVKPFEQARDRHLGAAIENAPTDGPAAPEIFPSLVELIRAASRQVRTLLVWDGVSLQPAGDLPRIEDTQDNT